MDEGKKVVRYKDVVLKGIYTILLIFSISLTLILCGEAIIREGFIAIYVYIYSNKLAVVLAVLLVMLLIIILYCIFNNMAIATLITGLFYIGAQTINYYKYLIKGEYVAPSDINLLMEATNIISGFDLKITSNVIWAVLCLCWLVLIISKIQLKIKPIRWRLMLGVISLVSSVFLISTIKNNESLAKIGIEIDSYIINNNYEKNGFLLTFINTAQKLNIEKPEGYGYEEIISIIQNENVILDKNIKETPNIIMIMSEAFIDVTKLPNIAFSKEPTPYFKQLQKGFTSGNIIVPVFGGYTVQTEYEVLTGNSTDFTGANNVAYMKYIYDDFPSIVSILNEIDYNTVAIHPYKKDFYSRNIAYEKLGFKSFIHEEDFENPERIRSYISDKELVQRIIAEYEKEKGKSKFFAHVVTMQNHGPYTPIYNENNIDIKSKYLNEENRNIIQTYANLLNDSDRALKYLIEYFETIDEPTIVVMFGDHAPVLGSNNDVYKQLGVLEEVVDVNQQYAIHHTPFVIWNNYGLDTKKYGDIDASYLGAVVLEEISLRHDKYFNYLYSQITNIKAYNENFYINQDGSVQKNGNMSEDTQRLLKNMWLLQYDRIFGENYGKKGE